MKNTLYSLIFCLLLGPMYGQEIDDHEIEVLKDYNDQIYAALPIYDFNSIRLPDQNQTGTINDSLINLRKYSPQMAMSVKPLAFKRNRMDRGYDGYIKADKGIQQLLGVRGGYTQYAENYYSLGVQGTYDNWQDPNIASKYHKEISGSMNLDYYINKSMKASLQIGAESQDWGRYGFNMPQLNDEIPRQKFMNHTIALGLSSFENDASTLSYFISLQAKNLTEDQTDLAESNLTFNGGASLRFNDNQYLIFRGTVFRSKLNIRESQSFATGRLNYRVNARNWDFRVGASAITSNQHTSFFPNLALHVTTDFVELSATLEERIHNANLNHILTINPYVDFDQFNSFHTMYRRLGLGLKSKIEQVGIQFDAEYLQIENGQNFLNSVIDRQLFMVSGLTYDLLKSSVKANYDLNPFHVGLKLEHNLLVKQEDELFHLPVFIVSPFFQYSTFDSKLLVEVRAEVNTGQDLAHGKSGSIRSGWRKDVSAQVRYKIHDRFNVYINADNVLNDTYQIFNGYEVFGRNVSGGLLFKF